MSYVKQMVGDTAALATWDLLIEQITNGPTSGPLEVGEDGFESDEFASLGLATAATGGQASMRGRGAGTRGRNSRDGRARGRGRGSGQ